MNKLAYLMMIFGFVLGGTAAQQVEYIDPAGGYTQVVTVTDRGVKTVFVSGQVGEGTDFAAHVESAFAGVVQRLEQAGATVNDVVKIRIFVKDLLPELYDTVAAMRRETFPEDSWPASTLLGIPALASERFQIEIDAIAVLGDDGAVEREFIGLERTYTQVVTARGTGPKTIYLAGQVGRPGDSLAEQAEQVYANLARRLAAVGASPSDLLNVTVYIPGFSETDLAVLGPARQKHGFLNGTAPASTLLGIQSLYSTEAGIEVEGIAVVHQ
jgi:enamine deaminase RidA (YjgF/YER057c/UK114 family)